MPIYEYRRPDGTTFELQQSFSDEPLKVDPDTGVPVERVLHAPAVHFKGKGFYNTDYGTRKRQRETAAHAESSSSKDSSSKDSGGSKDSSSKDGSSSGGDSSSSSGAAKSESSSKGDSGKKSAAAAKSD
jgi:putative FmdB family regulatory protein